MKPQQPPKRSPTAKRDPGDRERPTGYTTASKLFIIATLKHILHECETAARQDGDHQSVPPYPFEETFLRNCLNQAKTYCIQNIHEESLYGPSKFKQDDLSTYWAEPSQYSSWWKNFIERKAAYEKLVTLAKETHGSDKRRQK